MKRKSFPHVFFAVATIATSIFSFSVPSQAGEYGYLDELEKMAEKQGVKHHLNNLSVSEKLERGKEFCEVLEDLSVKEMYSSLQELSQNFSQKGYSEEQVEDIVALSVTILYSSAKELCPEYEYKLYKFVLKYSGD